jgi:DNA-directed RNA polymerase specialized sigma24 family protein
MLDLALDSAAPADLVYVQEEPALEIAIPQVFDQPILVSLQRCRLPRLDLCLARVARRAAADPAAPLGEDYQDLVTEFQPLFTWAVACWDYLLTVEGVRFLPRQGEQKAYVRGDYRAFTDRDYSRLTHRVFRECVLEYLGQAPAAEAPTPSLSQWLRARFWPRVVDGYRALSRPPDARQRDLSPYSYLRCVPYRFLNAFHDTLVRDVLQRLPQAERDAIDAYFLHFFTLPAAARHLSCPPEACGASLHRGLTRLLLEERLVYCLLRQIERY